MRHGHRRAVTLALVVTAALAGGAVPARAGYVMSYVSITGTDSGTCERSAPCKTLNYAVPKTGVGGEVVLLDSGTYAAATINRSVEVSGAPGVRAVISAPTSPGIVIGAGAGKDVTLRNIVVRGKGNDGSGIVVNSGEVELRNVRIARFGGHGVHLKPPAADDDDLTVVDSEINRNGKAGISMEPGVADVIVRGSEIDRNGTYGVRVGAGNRNITVRRSEITRNLYGAVVDNDGGGSGTISVTDSELSRNGRGQGYGVIGSYGRVIRLRDVRLAHNQWAVSAYGGAVMEIRDCEISHNAWGILVSNLGAITKGFVEGSAITHNGYGIWPEGGTLRVGRSTLAYNSSAIHLDYGGTVYSYGDNAVHDNGGGQAFSGTAGRY